MPYAIVPPSTTPCPLVCDSPHSGTRYPDDFRAIAPMADLRQCEDTGVESLWAAVPSAGGWLLHAHFPRSYIDPNRSCNDIDPAQLSDVWPGSLQPSDRCLRLGNGLVYSRTNTLAPIYAQPLAASEVQHRIDTCWRPYRQALRALLDEARQAHGRVWHLNLHSMPSNAYERLGMAGRGPLADVVLGDLHGRSCTPAFTRCVAEAFGALGYSVAVNDPYAGQDLVRSHGRPEEGCDSLQIELNRKLYLDEATRQPNAACERTRADIGLVLERIRLHIHAELGLATSPITEKESS